MIIKSGFSIFLGFRNFFSFRKGKKRTMAGAAITIALSLIPLIVVIEVADGMIEGITRRFIELETGHIQANPVENMALQELEKVCSNLDKISGIKCSYPVYSGTGLIYSKETKTGIHLKAFPDDIMTIDVGFKEYLEIIEGNFELSDADGIMLSEEVSKKLMVHTGDQIKILTAKTAKNGHLLLRPESLTVKGIFSTGYYEVDALSAYIGLSKGEKLFKDQGDLVIRCKINNPYKDTQSVTNQIIQKSGTPLLTTTWFRLQSSMYESLYTTRTLLVFIMTIIVIVAAVNITSSMIIMVIEKQTDIAILKSYGATPKQIRKAFIFTGFFIGLCGTVIGISTGLIVSININLFIKVIQNISAFFNNFLGTGYFSLLSASGYYLENIPIEINFVEIIIIAISSILLSIMAAILPAVKAEKMMPIEIIRKH